MIKLHCCLLLMFVVIGISYAQIDKNFEFSKPNIPDDFDSCIKYCNFEEAPCEKYVKQYQGGKLVKSSLYVWDIVNKQWPLFAHQEFLYEFDHEGKLNKVTVMMADSDSKNEAHTMNPAFQELFFYNKQNQLINVIIQAKVNKKWNDYKSVFVDYENGRIKKITRQQRMVTDFKTKARLANIVPNQQYYGYKADIFEFERVHKAVTGLGITNYITFEYLPGDSIQINSMRLDFVEYYYHLRMSSAYFTYNSDMKCKATAVQLNTFGTLIIKCPEKDILLLKNKNTITYNHHYFESKNYMAFYKYVYYYGYTVK